MADIDIDPFGEHESRPERSSTWEPDRGEQETSFRGESQKN